MQEQVATTLDETPPKKNPGWFQPGDRRINREGRPKGCKAGAQGGSAPADLAPRADRLKVLFLSGRDLTFRVSQQNAPWITNLPADVEIVGSSVDAARDAVALVLRSKEFPRIARGTPIPEFTACFNGLRWRRS
jgi:hypothetical protein